MRCHTLEEMLDLVRGARASGSSVVSDHAAGCARCGEARGWVERLLDATAGGPLPEPPAKTVERALGVVPAPRAAAKLPRTSWIARLVQETLATAAPAGVRAGATDERRLLYQAGDAELDVEIGRQDVGSAVYRLTGQVLLRGGAQAPEVVAILWSDGKAVARASGDDMGMFVVRDVPPGSYRLEIWMPMEGHIMRVEPLTVGPAPREGENRLA